MHAVEVVLGPRIEFAVVVSRKHDLYKRRPPLAGDSTPTLYIADRIRGSAMATATYRRHRICRTNILPSGIFPVMQKEAEKAQQCT